MKKNIVKQIRKVAEELPIIMRNTCEKHIMTGAEMIEELELMKTEDNKPVLPSERYLVRQPVLISINHHRKMKKIYKELNVQGLSLYINAVKSHAEKQSNQ
jgi:hypothetical protein